MEDEEKLSDIEKILLLIEQKDDSNEFYDDSVIYYDMVD